mgnify:CR=1 FL=1
MNLLLPIPKNNLYELGVFRVLAKEAQSFFSVLLLLLKLLCLDAEKSINIASKLFNPSFYFSI